MKKSILTVLSATMLLAVSGGAQAEKAQWSYSGDGAPENWAKISPEFGSCAGKNQTPIDLSGFIEAELEPLKISYNPGGQEILNNGHTVQVVYAPGSHITVDGTQFELKQFHFHAPSENHINGKSFAMESHLVHADKDGNLAVLTVMYEEGQENAALGKFWNLMPKEEAKKRPLPSSFDAAQMLPADLDYYRFNGSLTTPPCTEGVRWLILKNPVTASKQQVEAFEQVMHHPNNRPLQPVNARPVLE